MKPLSKTIRFTRPLLGASLATSGEIEGNKGEAHALGETIQLMPHELEAIKRQVFDAGRKAGLEEAQVSHGEKLSQEVERCAKLSSELVHFKSDLIDEMQKAVAELVLEAVGRLLNGWQPDASDVEAMVASLLDDFDAEDHRMRIRLHHETLELLSRASQDRFKEGNPQLEFCGDSRLKPGECILEGRFGLADARYSEKLKNLSAVLTDE